MKPDWKKYEKVFEEFREMAKKYKVPVIMPVQHPRPPGYPPPPPRDPTEPYFIFVDYPDKLR
jgi:hypothetical protein